MSLYFNTAILIFLSNLYGIHHAEDFRMVYEDLFSKSLTESPLKGQYQIEELILNYIDPNDSDFMYPELRKRIIRGDGKMLCEITRKNFYSDERCYQFNGSSIVSEVYNSQTYHNSETYRYIYNGKTLTSILYQDKSGTDTLIKSIYSDTLYSYMGFAKQIKISVQFKNNHIVYYTKSYNSSGQLMLFVKSDLNAQSETAITYKYAPAGKIEKAITDHRHTIPKPYRNIEVATYKYQNNLPDTVEVTSYTSHSDFGISTIIEDNYKPYLIEDYSSILLAKTGRSVRVLNYRPIK